MERKQIKQKRITEKRVRWILEAITAEQYEDAMNLCEYWRISPKEWRFILNNSTKTPEELAETIKTKRKERQNK
jgi:hypothetical protein